MSVESAAEFAVPRVDGSLRVDGAVTVRTPRDLTTETLRSHLASILPRHALPERIAILDEMPKTSSGKIDRRALATLVTNH